MAGAVTGRHQQVCYIKGGKITDYALMSVFTENTEKPSAQTVDKKYTVNKSTTKNVGSYEWEMEFTGDIIKSDEVAKDFVDVGRRMLVGSDCIRDLILVDLDETAESKSGEFYARQLSVVVAVSEFGDNDGEMQVSGSLYAQSDVTEGSFNVQTKQFTAKSEG